MVVCVLIPRFPLVAALGGKGVDRRQAGDPDRRVLLSEPVALAPEAGREQRVGEVSAPAEAFGVTPGLRVGEALARCPELRLVPPDPEAVRSLWGDVLDRLEAIGAAPESEQPGAAFFEAKGLTGIHGGLEGVLAATRHALGSASDPPLRSPGRSVRLGAAPSRFASYAAALQARARRRSIVVPGREVTSFLGPLPLALLRSRPELQALPEVLERLGIRTLGELASLPPRALAERFGHPGLLALDLAQGRDTPLQPRRPPEPVVERLPLPEATSGEQLERALELLLARLLARRERRGRTLRALALSARFVAGGTWRLPLVLRAPSADPSRLRLLLAPRLAELPAPAEELALEVESFGPPARDQCDLIEDPAAGRRARLGEAVRQVRQAAGPEAALRVLEVDSESRIPERRAVLAPFPERL
jgi:protein ImuB